MNKKLELIKLLEQISEMLLEDNKIEVAKFFLFRAEQLKKNLSDENIDNICNELTTCSAISQYANFTIEQDNLLHNIYKMATMLKY